MSAFGLLETLLDATLPLVYKGKVHNIYRLPGGALLIVVSDRRSIYDFHLGFEVEGQGAILNAFNIMSSNLLQLLMGVTLSADLYQVDLMAYGWYIDPYLAQFPQLQGLAELQRRATVVIDLDVLPVESIARHVLTGGGYREYQRTGKLCGHTLPEGWVDAQMIRGGPIWTPTTKAKKGHDDSLDYAVVNRQFPGMQSLHKLVSEKFAERALERGVILGDNKVEMGYAKRETPGYLHKDKLVIGDERFTPDCSRFFLRDEYVAYLAGKGPFPDAHDKEILRTAGKAAGIHLRNPELESDREFVAKWVPAPEVLVDYRAKQLRVFEMLYEMTLEEFERDVLEIAA